MNTKIEIKDMVILLPGIMGSVLKKNNTTLWDVSGEMVKSLISSWGENLGELSLENANVDDDVIATGLLKGGYVIPKFLKFDGYEKLESMLKQSFEFSQSADGEFFNFFAFPYDWRKDNRTSANKLKDFIQVKLDDWRNFSKNEHAKVIFVCHSMGGLVARYYTEVLGGWKNCRMLVTCGTPYRGSLNALDVLVNGYQIMGKEIKTISSFVRGLPSVYQLLPRYPVIWTNDDPSLFPSQQSKYVREVMKKLPNLSEELVANADNFHQEIESAVARNQGEKDYVNCAVVPFVGAWQPTKQSATLVDGCLNFDDYPPPEISANTILYGGDNTVPSVSAIPIEFSTGQDLARVVYVNSSHAFIQSNSAVLNDIRGKIAGLSQASTLLKFKGSFFEPALQLKMEDVFVTSSNIIATVVPYQYKPQSLNVEVVDRSQQQTITQQITVEWREDMWSISIEKLPHGIYQISITDVNKKAFVSDVFLVLPEEDL